MRKVVLAATVFAFAVACSDPRSADRPMSNRSSATPASGGGSAVPAYQPNEAPRISLAAAKQEFDAGTAVFIDTHSAEQFAKQHIPGAINISVSELAAKENKIPKGKKIIAYCS